MGSSRWSGLRWNGPPKLLRYQQMTVSELLRVADHLDPAGQQMVRKAYERAASAHTRPAPPVRRGVRQAPARGRRDPRRPRARRRRRSPPPCCTTPSRTPPLTARRGGARVRSATVAHLVDGRHQAGQDRAALRPAAARPRTSARCWWRWPRTCGSSSSSSPTACTTCAPLDPLPEVKRRRIARETLDIYAPARAPARHRADQVGARGPRLPQPRARRVRGVSSGSRASARTARRSSPTCARSWRASSRRSASRPNHRPAEAHLLDLAEDDAREQGLLARSTTSRDPGAGRLACKDCYGVLGVVHSLWKPVPGPLQGLHRDAEVERLPVPAHDGDHAHRRADRDPDPHASRCTASPSSASPRTGPTRRAAHDAQASTRSSRWLRRLHGMAEGGDRTPSRSSTRSRSTSSRTRSSSSRRKGDVYNLPAGLDARRLRLPGPHRGGPPLHRRQGQRPDGAARLRAGERRDRRDPHLEGPARPSRDWLNFVKSASARERIRKWFKSQRREENVAKGRDLLEKELHRMHRLTLGQLPDGKLDEMARTDKYVQRLRTSSPRSATATSPRTRCVMRMALSQADDGDEPAVDPAHPQRPAHPPRAGAGRAGHADHRSRRAASRCRATPSPATPPGARASRVHRTTASTR